MPPGRVSRPLLVALFTIFIDILGFGIIIPVQPFYAESFGADPTLVTLLGATFSAMQFMFAPMWGRLSDRIGRRPIILVSVAISMIGHVLFATAGALWMLFVARIVTGVGTANFGAAQAVVADTTSGADRARGMGLLGAAFGMGFVLGPGIGGALSQVSPAAPFWVSGALAAVNLALAWFNLPETHPPERRVAAAGAVRRRTRWFAFLDAGGAGRYPNLVKLLVLTALAVTGMGLMEQALGLLIERVWVPTSPTMHEESAGLTAIVLTIVGVTSATIQGGLLGRLTRRYGERRLIRFGASAATIGLALIAVAAASGSFVMLAVGSTIVLASGTACLFASSTAFISRSVPAEHQGRWLGIGQSLSALGRTVGPAFSGLLFARFDLLPFLVGSALMAGAALTAFMLSPLREHTVSVPLKSGVEAGD